MESAVQRLQSIADQLERALAGLGANATAANASSGSTAGSSAVREAYGSEVLGVALKNFLDASAALGGLIDEAAKAVANAFRACDGILAAATTCKAPSSNADPGFQALMKPVSDAVGEVCRIEGGRPPVKLINHLKALAAAIVAMNWVSVEERTPVPLIKECIDSADFYLLRVRKDSAKDSDDYKWTVTVQALFNALIEFVKANCKTGIDWNHRGVALGSAPAAPSAAAAPAPAVAATPAAAASGGTSGASMHALFSQINTSTTSGLRKVDPSMQTHKNPALRAQAPLSNASVSLAPASPGGGGPGVSKMPKGTPKLELKGAKWTCEFQSGRHDLEFKDVDQRTTIYIYGCVDCTITVVGKANTITLDSCKNVAIKVESVISAIDCVNCTSVEAQITGAVPTMAIEKTEGAKIYASKEAFGMALTTAMSTGIVVYLPPKKQGDDEHIACFVPEQLRSVIAPSGTGLFSTGVEHAG